MAIKEEHGLLGVNSGYNTETISNNNTSAIEVTFKKDLYIKGLRVYYAGTGSIYTQKIFICELYPKTLTNTLYNSETYKLLGEKQTDQQIVESSNWSSIKYFDKPIRVYANRTYILGFYVSTSSGGTKGPFITSYNTNLIYDNIYIRCQEGYVYNPQTYRRKISFAGDYAHRGNLVDFIADTFDYSYLVRDRKETKKIFVPTIDTDLTLSQDNLGDWSLNKLQSNNTTSVSFPIFKDVKYNLMIPEGAKFCYAGTLDKKVSDFEDAETRVLNRILVDDATVTNPLELEFTALQNERGFVAYINDADAGLTPDQVTLTGTAGYELYKLTNEEGTEYEALPDFDITSEQFKNGSPLFVEPQANVLMDFAHPSVLYWQELETDNPMLQVKITATPHSQHVTGDKISLEVDGVLCDIAEMQVDSEGGAILAFSFDDKQTWVYWKPENENDVNVGEWVTITEADRFNGQSKDVTDALSPANWKLAIGDADGFYIRASFISTSQSLSKIGVKFAVRDTAATTEVETEGTD